jgi:hypothetical protein
MQIQIYQFVVEADACLKLWANLRVKQTILSALDTPNGRQTGLSASLEPAALARHRRTA